MPRKKNKLSKLRETSLGNFFDLVNEDSLKEMNKEDARLLTGEQIETKAAAQETLAWIEGEGAGETSETKKEHQPTEPTDAIDMLKELFN